MFSWEELLPDKNKTKCLVAIHLNTGYFFDKFKYLEPRQQNKICPNTAPAQCLYY